MTYSASRTLTLTDAVSVVIGIIIGAGIFVSPQMVARSLPLASGALATWVLGMALVFCGGLAFAELAGMYPRTGGQYHFLKETYGSLAGFLCGWAFFFIIQPGVGAFLALSFGRYAEGVTPLGTTGQAAVAVVVVWLLTAVNILGLQRSALLQRLSTAAKLVGILLLFASALFVRQPAAVDWSVPPLMSFPYAAFGVAFLATVYAYEGWSFASFLVGDLKDPGRDLPRAYAIGLSACAALYLAANVAYLRVLGVAGVAASDRAAALVAETALGPTGGWILTATALLCIVSSLNGILFAPSRIYLAQAQDGLFFPQFAVLHPRFQTPWIALITQAVLATAVIWTGWYEALLECVIFTIWLINVPTVAAVALLRRRDPQAQRPYRMWGYPWTLLLFVGAGTLFLGNTVRERGTVVMTGLAILAAGIPAFWFWKRSR